MNLKLNVTQSALKETLVAYCKKSSKNSTENEAERRPPFSREKHWRAFAALGWLGASFPEELQGSGGTIIETSIISEELGRGLIREPYWDCAIYAARLIFVCGSEEQHECYLRPLIAGNMIIVVAHQERDLSDAYKNVQMEAIESSNGDFCLTGKKSAVIYGNIADYLLVTAQLRLKATNEPDLALFIVSRRALGLSQITYDMIDGSSVCNITFDSVIIPGNQLVGRMRGASEAISYCLDEARTLLCSEAIGIMASVLDECRSFLITRRQYGTTLNTFQVLQHRMADMFVELELSRSIVMRALIALLSGEQEERRPAALAAQVQVAKSGMFICKNGIQLHGAMGMVEEGLIGNYFKRMTVISGLLGRVDENISQFSSLVISKLGPEAENANRQLVL